MLESQTVVLVHGTNAISEDTLDMYMESERRTGGGDCVSVRKYDLHDMALVVFRHPEVASRVCSRSALTISDQTVRVEMLEYPRSVQISNISPQTTLDVLELYLESSRVGGGPIDEVNHHDQEQGVAVVTYQDQQVAVGLLTRKEPLTFGGRTLVIMPRLGGPDPREVIVSGIPPSVSEETLEMLFENEKRTGGGTINSFSCDISSGTAVIKFEEENVAARVLQRDSIRCLGGIILTVRKPTLIPPPDKVTAQGSFQSMENVCVEGISEATTKMTLEMFFESERRSGGGEIKQLEFQEGSGKCIITFQDPEVAKRVLQRKLPIKLDDTVLQIKKQTEPTIVTYRGSQPAAASPDHPTPVNRRISVRGLSKKMSKDALSMYFESGKYSDGGPIESVELYPEHGMAEITYQDASVACRVLQTKKELKLDDCLLIISPTDDVPQNSIMVEGLECATSKQTIMMYFESERRSGGGDITDLQHDPAAGSAVITFEDEGVSKRVLNRGKQQSLILDDAVLTVRKVDPLRANQSSPITKPAQAKHIPLIFAIRKLASAVGESEIKQALTSVRIIEVQDIKLHYEVAVAVVRLIHQKDAIILSQRKEMKIDGSVSPIFPLDDSAITACKPSAIHINGLPDDTSEEVVELFFSNPLKSGGGKISNCFVDEEAKTATVTFASNTSVEGVLKMHHSNPLTLSGKRIFISSVEAGICPRYLEGPTSTLHYAVRYAPEVSLEQMNHFLSQTPSKIQASGLLYSTDEETLMLQFDVKPDFTELVQLCWSKPLNDRMITIENLPESRMVQVYNHTGGRQALETYFKSSFRSTGNYIREEHIHQCTVFKFHNVDMFHRVLQVRHHSISSQVINVLPYYDDIGFLPPSFSPEMPWSAVPDSFGLPLTDNNIYDFLKNSSKAKGELDAIGNKNNMFGIDWLNSDSSHLTVYCVPQVKGKYCEKKRNPSAWENECRTELEGFFTTIRSESIKTSHDLYHKTLDEAKKNLDEDDIYVKDHRNSDTLVLVGWETQVRKKMEQIRDFYDKLFQKANAITDAIRLQEHQLELLQMVDYISKLKNIYPELTISLHDSEVRFKGLQEHVKAAQDTFRDDFIDAICSFDQNEALLSERNTFEYIRNEAKKQNLNISLKQSANGLTIYAASQSDLTVGRNFISDCLRSSSYPLDAKSKPVIKSGQWKDLKDKLKLHHAGQFRLVEGADTVELACIKSLYSDISKKVENFLNTNALKTELVELAPVKVRLLNHQKNADKLRNIKDNHKGSMASFTPLETSSRSGLTVTASLNTLPKIIDDIKKLAQSIKSDDFDVEEPWMTKFCSSPEFVRELENCYPLTCEIIRPQIGGLKAATGPTSASSSRAHNCIITAEGKTIELKKGHIETMSVDAIVNTLKPDMEPTGTKGSTAITKAAGSTIKSELKKFKSAQFGSIRETGAGDLTTGVKKIYHVPLMHWAKKDPQQKQQQKLRVLISELLETANNDGMTSLAMPAIGAGNWGWAGSMVATCIIEQAELFSRTKPGGCLKDIMVVIYDTDDKSMKEFSSVFNGWSAGPGISQPPGSSTASQVAHTAGSSDSLITQEGMSICLHKGSITTVKVDAIVNTGPRDLKLENSGAVSKAIIMGGGRTIQDELDKHIAINFGDVVQTSAGQLPSRYIFHGACQEWKDGQLNCEKILSQTMQKTLDMASQLGLVSLAFPAIGTGNLSYPRQFVANKMFEIIKNFSQQNPRSSLKRVMIVLFDRDLESIKVFEDVLQQQKQAPASNMQRTTTTIHAVQTGSTSGGIAIKITKGSITTEQVDAIVNTGNRDLKLDSSGAVSKAILREGGPSIQTELDKHNAIKFGDIVKTRGGTLPSKHIFHTSCPQWSEGEKECEKVLNQTMQKALTMGSREGLRSIAFPAIGTGNLGYPRQFVAEKMFQEAENFSQQNPLSSVKEIRIVLYDQDLKSIQVFEDVQRKRQQSQTVLQSPSIATGGPVLGATGGPVLGATGGSVLAATGGPVLAATGGPVFGAIGGPVFGATGGPVFGSGTRQYASIRHHKKPDNPVTIHMYAMQTKILDDAKEFLKEKIREKSAEQIFNKPEDQKLISRLDQRKVHELTALAAQYRMHFSIEQDPNQSMIKVKCHVKDINMFCDAVHKALRGAYSDRVAQAAYKTVQWGMDKTSGFTVFDAEVSHMISQALEEQDTDSLRCTSGLDIYDIDLRKMTASSSGITCPIRKKLIGSDDITLPSNWTNVPDGKDIWYNKVTLAAGDPEYLEVHKGFAATCKKHVSQIERIQSPNLYRSYAVKKKEIERTCPPGIQVERKLYHGTDASVLESIDTNGFNRSYCGKNATRFGRGVYFAVNASYSAQGRYSVTDKTTSHRYMYVCRVLTGEYTTGKEKYIVPPAKDPKNPNIQYNSCVDKMTNMDMFVIFHDSQAYPEYLITFN